MFNKSHLKPYIIPFGKGENNEINLVINQNYEKHHFSIDDDTINYYPSRNGKFLQLIEQIAIYIGCDKNEILPTHGSENALKLIMETFCKKGTRVLIPVPNYPGFIHKAELYKAKIDFFRFSGKEEEYEAFYERMFSNDIIYISTPNLPLGYELKDSIYEMIGWYPEKLFIIDEAYFEYGDRLNSFYKPIYKNMIIVRTFSKAFALAGARVGYIIADENLIDKLRVAYCDKDITDHSTQLCLNALLNKEYYLNQVVKNKKNWGLFFDNLYKFISKNDIIYEFQVGKGPYFLLFTEYTEYVCFLFKKNKYLVRDKTKDIGRGCIRISLNIEKIMNDVLYIIKKINGYYKDYSIVYFDIDKTIRETNASEPVNGVTELINELGKNKIINFITNNIANYEELCDYFIKNRILFNKLICPFRDFNINSREYNNGYFFRDNNLYITKFPNITYELINHIYKNKIIHIIEEDYTESSKESGFTGEDIDIPFIGSFQELLENHKISVEFKIIGKKNIYIPNIDKEDKEVIVIGDSNDDLLFAINNGFYFKRVTDCKSEIKNIIKNII